MKLISQYTFDFNKMREITLYFYIVSPNVIWTNQNTESFVYQWLRALTKLDVTGFPAFVRASNIISSILLIN